MGLCTRAFDHSTSDYRRWRSNPSEKSSQERLTQGTVISTKRKAAHLPVCARCGAGAGCSAIKHQPLYERCVTLISSNPCRTPLCGYTVKQLETEREATMTTHVLDKMYFSQAPHQAMIERQR